MRRELIFLSLIFIVSLSYAFAPKLKQKYSDETAINQEFRNVYENLLEEDQSLKLPHGTVYDNTTQNVVNTALAQEVIFSSNGHINGIVHSTAANLSKIYVTKSGSYLIIFSALIGLDSGATNQDVDIWIRVNGIDVSDSNTSSRIAAAGDKRVVCVNYIIELNKNDYIELVMSGTNTRCKLLYIAPGTSPTRPGVPSIILTINKIEI